MPATQNVTKLNVRRTATATITSKYRDAQALREQKRSLDKIIPVIHITINTVQDKTPKIKEKKSKSKAIDVPCAKNISSRHIQEKDKKPDRYEKTRLIFPELRGSKLYSKCDCLYRNGLQDDCRLSQCLGQPKCLVKPWAICPPAKFVRSRFPEIYPSESRTVCTAK